jgi:ketosteroid isomerase-like protein
MDAEEALRRTYRAFNDRDVDAVLEQLHPDVDWPNAWEGGRVVGRDAVREYWTRQFEEISGRVEPESFTEDPDGAVTVEVHQVVHDAKSGDLLTDARVRHRYWFDDAGLVTRMEVLEDLAFGP